MAIFLISVLMALCFLVLGQTIYWRLFPSDSPRLFAFSIWALGSLMVSVLAGWLFGADASSCVAILWAQIAIIAWYFFLYTGVARSVSVTLLIDLRIGIKESELLVKYEKSSRFEDRIQLLESLGWILRDGEKVQLTTKGKNVAKRFVFLSKVFGYGVRG